MEIKVMPLFISVIYISGASYPHIFCFLFILFPFHSSASREPFDSVPVPESVRRIMEKKIKKKEIE